MKNRQGARRAYCGNHFNKVIGLHMRVPNVDRRHLPGPPLDLLRTHGMSHRVQRILMQDPIFGCAVRPLNRYT